MRHQRWVCAVAQPSVERGTNVPTCQTRQKPVVHCRLPRILCLPASQAAPSFQMILAAPQGRTPRLQQRTLLEQTGRECCHIVPRVWPCVLEASVFLKDATRAARLLFVERKALATIHMFSATADNAPFGLPCFLFLYIESCCWWISNCVRNNPKERRHHFVQEVEL